MCTPKSSFAIVLSLRVHGKQCFSHSVLKLPLRIPLHYSPSVQTLVLSHRLCSQALIDLLLGLISLCFLLVKLMFLIASIELKFSLYCNCLEGFSLRFRLRLLILRSHFHSHSLSVLSRFTSPTHYSPLSRSGPRDSFCHLSIRPYSCLSFCDIMI